VRNSRPFSLLVDGGNLDLTISVVAAGGGAEWLVLNFQTVSADLPLSTGGQTGALTQACRPPWRLTLSAITSNGRVKTEKTFRRLAEFSARR
jgi:hypothetical protein